MTIASESLSTIITPQAQVARSFIDKLRAGEFTDSVIFPDKEELGQWATIATAIGEVYCDSAFCEGGSIPSAQSGVEDMINFLRGQDEAFKVLMDYGSLDDLPPIEIKPDEMPALPNAVCPNHELALEGMSYLLSYVPFSERWAPFAPRVYHVNAGLFLLSVITARRLVVMNVGEPEYTALYFLFAGPSSVGKSATAKKALYVLEKLGLNHLLVHEGTPEWFKRESAGYIPDEWDDLEDDEQSKKLFKLAWSGKVGQYIDEIGQLFKTWFNPTSVMGQWPKILLEWEDSRLTDGHSSISNGSYTIENPYLSWLGCLTFSSIKKMQSVLDGFDNGFFARMVLCVAPPPPEDEEIKRVKGNIFIPSDLYDGLKSYHERLRIPRVNIVKKEKSKDTETKGSKKYKLVPEAYPEKHVELTDEASDYLDAYSAAIIKLSRRPRLVPPEIAPNYNRLTVKVLRCAAMLAHYDGCSKVQLCHVHAAVEIAETLWRPSMHSFYQFCFAPPPTLKKMSEDRVYTYIERQSKAGRWVTLSDIGRDTKIDKESIAKSLKYMLDEDAIQMAKKPPSRKNGTAIVKYALPTLKVPSSLVQ